MDLQMVHNQPYDETVEISDGEEIASTNPTPRTSTIIQSEDYNDQVQQQSSHIEQGSESMRLLGGEYTDESRMKQTDMMYGEDDDEEDDSHDGESEDEEEPDGRTQIQRTLLTSICGYDPAEFDHLQVNTEIKDLFQYITRYTPQNITLDTKLMPFIPDYVPAIGDIDAFMKVTRPDGKSDNLGLAILDEPSARQSDPHVLDLQLRTHAKQVMDKPAPVHSIEEPDKNSKAMESWIENIKELHRLKPAANVHYTRNMPNIESLMQEWPAEFEDLIKQISLPTAELDCELQQYADILCGILDIPVYGNRIHSLHILFSLFMEFKNSQHFNQQTEQ